MKPSKDVQPFHDAAKKLVEQFRIQSLRAAESPDIRARRKRDEFALNYSR